MTDNYRLAKKLKREFRERGSDVGGMRATTTSELMRRAEMGRDPRINCAEQAFRENYDRQNRNSRCTGSPNADVRMRRDSMAGVSYVNAAERSFRREAPRKDDARGSYRAETLRGHHTVSTAAPNDSARSARFARTDASSAVHNAAPSPAAAAASAIVTEKQVQKKMIPPVMLAFLIVGTVLFLSFIFSITEVYKASRQLDELQNQLGQLEETAQDMELQLEEKNDIREIEAIATGKLGMVKEDSLQRRFVSLSDGERIELAEMPEETTAGGVMLSSVFSALGRFFERFR